MKEMVMLNVRRADGARWQSAVRGLDVARGKAEAMRAEGLKVTLRDAISRRVLR